MIFRFLAAFSATIVVSSLPPGALAQTKIGSQFEIGKGGSAIIARLKNGGFVAVWSERDGVGQGYISSQAYQSSGAPVDNSRYSYLCASNELEYCTPLSVFGLSNGRFVVVWSTSGFRPQQFSKALFGRVFEASGAPASAPFQINSFTKNEQGQPAIAALNDGAFVVVWTSRMQDGSKRGIYGHIFDGSGNKIGDEFRVNSRTANDQFDPAVALTANGGFVVAYHSIYGKQTGTYAQRFDSAGQHIGTEFRVDDGNFATIWSAANGGFVVEDTIGHLVVAQRFTSAGARTGALIQIARMPGSTVCCTTVRRLATGDFLFTWFAYKSGSENEHLARRYSPLGLPRGPAFLISPFTKSSEISPARLAALVNGTFVSIWNDGAAIYGQIFE
jgi:hypothetical protein